MPKEPTNMERAERIERILSTISPYNEHDTEEDAATDLLADLMHYCTAHKDNVSFERCLTMAYRHFDAERRGE
jgi:chorismate mutase